VRLPVSPSDRLSIFWAADWWSRWQKATPGIVPETTEDLSKVLISAFWRGEITDAEPNERLKISRLTLLRSLCDRAKGEFEGADIRTLSVFGFDIPTPKGRSSSWADDSCNSAFLYMAEYWAMMAECVEGFNTEPGVDPKLRAITVRLKHLPLALQSARGVMLSRDQFLGLIGKRGYQRPTFWDGEEKPVEEPRDAEPTAELRWGKKPTVLKKGAHLTVVRSNDNPILSPPAGSERPNLTRRKRGQKRSEKSIKAEHRLEAAVNSDPALFARLNILSEKELAKICGCDPDKERHHIRTARDSVLNKLATK
jgi:hypothetical protein